MPQSNVIKLARYRTAQAAVGNAAASRGRKTTVVMPNYVRKHEWKDGVTESFHWAAPSKAIEAGFLPAYENLGKDPIAAAITGRGLFERLQKFMMGSASMLVTRSDAVGTWDWARNKYIDDLRACGLLAKITIDRYKNALKAGCNHRFKSGPYQGVRLGDIPVKEIDPNLTNQFRREFLPRPGYTATEEELQAKYVPPSRKRAKRIRQTHTRHVIDTLRTAHNTLQKGHSDLVPAANPWVKMGMKVSQGRTPCATSEMTAMFVAMADRIGEQNVGTLVMATHIFLERAMCIPTELTVDDYRPSYRPNEIRIYQSKKDTAEWFPLTNEKGKLLFPKLTRRLDMLKKQMHSGPLIPARIVNGVGVPWKENGLNKKIRMICDLCKFPKDISLRAFRKGGIVQSGEAGLTHTQIRGQTGHSSAVLDRYLQMTHRVIHPGVKARAKDLNKRVPGVF